MRLTSVLASALTVAVITGSSLGVKALAATQCSIRRLGLGEPAGNSFVVSGDQVTANFNVEGSDCSLPVTLAGLVMWVAG